MARIIDTTRASGATVKVDVEMHAGRPMAFAKASTAAGTSSAAVMMMRSPLVVSGVTYTHAIGRVALTADEAAQVTEALAALALTPAAIAKSQRDAEASALWSRQCAAAEDVAARADAWERGDVATAVTR